MRLFKKSIDKNCLSNNLYRFAVFAYLLLFSFAICMLSRQSIFASVTPLTDSSVFMTVAKGMMAGKTPYIDFFDHKGPFLYLINYLGYSLGGIRGVWFAEIIAITVAVIFSYAAVKKLYGQTVALCSVTFGFLVLRLCFEGGNLTEEYVIPLISIALYISISMMLSEHFSAWKVLVLGFTFGLSLMLRPNMFAVWFVFSAYYVINCLIRKNFNTAIKYILFFIGGTAVSVLPFMVYLWYNQAFFDYIYQNFIFNSQYAKHGGVKAIILNILNVTYSFSSVIIVSLVACVVGFFTQKENKKTLFVLSLFSMILSIVFVSISQEIYKHYFMVFIPLITVSVSVLLALFKNAVLKYGVKNRLSELIVVALTFFVVFNGIYNLRCDIINIQEGASKNDIQIIAEKLNKIADKNDSCQVLGNNCSLYLYSDLKPANKFIYDFPIADISSDVHTQFIQAWTENPPTYVVSSQSYLESKSRHNKWVIVELKSHYAEIFKAGNYILYEAKK